MNAASPSALQHSANTLAAVIGHVRSGSGAARDGSNSGRQPDVRIGGSRGGFARERGRTGRGHRGRRAGAGAHARPLQEPPSRHRRLLLGHKPPPRPAATVATSTGQPHSGTTPRQSTHGAVLAATGVDFRSPADGIIRCRAAKSTPRIAAAAEHADEDRPRPVCAMTVNLPINIGNLLRRRTIESERVEYKAGWNPAGVLHALGGLRQRLPQPGRRLSRAGRGGTGRPARLAAERYRPQCPRWHPEGAAESRQFRDSATLPSTDSGP